MSGWPPRDLPEAEQDIRMAREYGTSVETIASPEKVWRVWSDMSTWGERNPNVSTMDWEGGFASGTAGVMNTKAGQHPQNGLVGVPAGRRHHGDDKRSQCGCQHDGSDLARPDRGPEWGPVDGCRAVQPRDEPGEEGGDRERPAFFRPRHLLQIEAALARRDRDRTQSRQQDDPNHEHHQADRKCDPRIRGLVDGREVGRAGPRGHRQRPDETREGGKAGPAESFDEPCHHSAYLSARY